MNAASDALGWIVTCLLVVWVAAVLLLALCLLYGLVLTWLTRRASHAIDAFAAELDAEERADQAYLDWLEATWHHPSSRVPRVPRDT